jgi:hypothetical protein
VAGLRPRTVSSLGVALAWVGFLVVMFAGFGGERAACPSSSPTWVTVLAILCALAATVGFALAAWAYSATAGEPSGDWLFGAAGLYVTALGWVGAIGGAGMLLAVDLCSF